MALIPHQITLIHAFSKRFGAAIFRSLAVVWQGVAVKHHREGLAAKDSSNEFSDSHALSTTHHFQINIGGPSGSLPSDSCLFEGHVFIDSELNIRKQGAVSAGLALGGLNVAASRR